MSAVAWTVQDGAVRLTVRLTPNARDETIEGVRLLADGKAVLAARVRAVPEDGAANAALEKLLAKAVGLAKSRVRVTSGMSQRLKIVTLEGEGAAIAGRLAALAGTGLS